MKLFLASAIIVIIGSTTQLCLVNAGGYDLYTYYEKGGLGPSRWDQLDIDGNQCGGTQGESGYGQSPVAIDWLVANNCDTNMDAYSFTGGTCTWDDLKFSISKNGVKVGPKPDAMCSFGNMTISHTGNEFNALQFHIHTFSEHKIEGMGDQGFFPAELHVVHQESTGESFAVFGTMIDVGTQDHLVFEYFLQGWEAEYQAVNDECNTSGDLNSQTSFMPKQEVVQCPAIGSTSFNPTPSFPVGEAPNVYDLPTDPHFGVFTYKGGLTTPGCTEIVNWNLLDTPMLISQSQLDRLETLILCFIEKECDDSGVSCYFGTVADEQGSTSRPPQPLNGRKVTHRCRDGPDVDYVDVGEKPPLISISGSVSGSLDLFP